MPLRKFLFWLHLCTGAVAGIVILIMSVTGVLLTYERQMIAWADRGFRSEPPSRGAARLSVEALLGRIRDARHATPSTFTLRSDPSAPAEAGFGREGALYVNPYTGELLGEGSRQIRAFFRVVTDWHRWLGVRGDNPTVPRAITGACNLGFLFLVMTGFYIWLPRKWSWRSIRPVILFRSGLHGKARDFNWHNVIGLWCATPLFLIVVSGVVMSYPWANKLVYRLTGSEPPAQGGPGSGRAGSRTPTELKLEGLDALWTRAEQQVSGWQSISLRLPGSGRAPMVFSIDEGNGGQPQKRSQLTLDRKTGEIVRWEPFSSYNRGRRIRSWLRFLHTGEAAGVAGQTVAGIASTGGAVLVWTGLALAWRRFRGWLARRRVREEVMVL